MASTNRNARPSFLDLTRGVTVSTEMSTAWPELYDAALRVDVERYRALEAAADEMLDGWETGLEGADVTLWDAVPDEVWACFDGVVIRPQLIPDEVPVCLDLNAVDAVELDALPGADPAWIHRALAARLDTPFTSVDDFLTRSDAPEGFAHVVLPHDSTP